MLRTIVIGSCVLVQGLFERDLGDGRIQIRVGSKLFEGFAIDRKAA